MNEVQLVVRELNRDWSGIVDVATADRAIAALSADPETLAELETAFGRFAKRMPDQVFLANLNPGLRDEPHDSGLVILDLPARIVVQDFPEALFEHAGQVCYHDGEENTDTYLPYRLDEEWLLTAERSEWLAQKDERRRERSERPLFDARAVFYGRPLLEHVARETFAAFQGTSKTDEDAVDDALKQIHAAWLLTPRPDLAGRCPRETYFENKKHLSFDLDDQCHRWSFAQRQPPGLSRTSFAYRHGGFGTHELVKYYYLVRELLGSCWERLKELAATGQLPALAVGDFLTVEVPRLEQVRDTWLDTPDPECHGRTPRSVIDRERLRLPEGMSGHDAIVDPDCPCCQDMADLPGPAFWHLDGCNMDDDFAFDIYRQTREEWEEEERRHQEFSRKFNEEWAERERRIAAGEEERPLWSSSYFAEDAELLPRGRLLDISTHLTELVDNIRSDTSGAMDTEEAQRCIDELNRDCGNLRDVVYDAEPATAAALIEPVIDRFVETLATVASARPDLAAKCESLTECVSKLRGIEAQELSWDAGEEDFPF